MRSALVLGASGQLGVAVAEELAVAGWRVAAVTRDGRHPPDGLLARGVEAIDGGGRAPDRLLRDLGRTVDAVFDPNAYDLTDAQNLVAALPRAGHLVVVSTASVYADAQGRSLETAFASGFPAFVLPVAEDAPCVVPGPETYSSRKAALEQVLLEAQAPVSILRAGAIHGRFAQHPREWWFVKRALDGRAVVPLAYDGRSRFHTAAAAGVASLALRCIEAGHGGVLNVADATAPDVIEIAGCIAAAIGLPIGLAPFSGPPMGPFGHSPWSTAGPLVLDLARARALGWTPPSYRTSVDDACSWLLETARQGHWRDRFPVMARYGYDPFDYAVEDAFLESRALI